MSRRVRRRREAPCCACVAENETGYFGVYLPPSPASPSPNQVLCRGRRTRLHCSLVLVADNKKGFVVHLSKQGKSKPTT